MNQVQVIVECGADTTNEKYPFTRKHYMHPMYTNQFRNAYNNIGVYETIMHYINPQWFKNEKGKWLVNARDSLKYGNFYLDFDGKITCDEDFIKIKEDVKTALKYFRTFLSIDINQVQFFFSGNKGIHLIIDARVIGLEPHVALNKIYKDIADDIKSFCKNGTLDTSVYDDKRMFRMVNSINKKSGLYKIPLLAQEFNDLSYSEIAMMARQPRIIQINQPVQSHKATKIFSKYVKEWSEKVEKSKVFTGKMKELSELPPCIKNMNERIFKETIDERNNSGTALASFYLQNGVDREEAMQLLLKWGTENCEPQLNRNNIEIIINSVYNGQYRYGCSTFERLSGVCNKENCPLFKKDEVKENE